MNTKADCERALRCLYIEVPAEVARDVNLKVLAHVDALEAENAALRKVAEAAQSLMRADPRPLDGMTDEAYRAWCSLRDALPVPPSPTGSADR